MDDFGGFGASLGGCEKEIFVVKASSAGGVGVERDGDMGLDFLGLLFM